jgi:type I restriction enzyme S subunit
VWELKMKKLIDICDIQYGYAFDSAYFTENSCYPPLARIRDVKRGYSETYYSGGYSEEYILASGDLLVGMDGEFNIARWKCDGALLNQRVCRLLAKKGTNEEYLRFAMMKVLKEIERRTAFVTVKHLSAKELNKLQLVVPDLSTQNKVAEILSRLEKIIGLRRQELKRLDDLIKARFVEMFGDPILNPKGWEMVAVGDIVTDVRYGTSKPAVEGGKYPYLRMNNLTSDGHLDLKDLKYIDISDDEIEKCVVRKGDVLFNRTNSIELVGKTAVFDLPEDMVIAGYIIRVRLNEKLLPEIFSQYMNLEAIKSILRGMAKGAVNQANINAQELQSIKVYIPSMELQNQFVEMKEQVDKSKFINQLL